MSDNNINRDQEAEHEGLAMGRAFRHKVHRRRNPSRGHGRPLRQEEPVKRTVIRVLNKPLAEVLHDLGL